MVAPVMTPEQVSAIPLAFYLHWPWCVRKCPYCDFNSHAQSPLQDEDAYVDAMLADIKAWRGRTGGRAVSTIFVGGGTPSLMPPSVMGRLLEAIDRLYGLTGDCEITMEANPGTVDESRFAGFRAAGVNRLSIGVQSIHDECLKALGRIHTAHEAYRAIDAAARHFDNFNLDFMFALPGQTIEMLEKELAAAVASPATHLSFYQLTIEAGTAFAKRVPAGLPDEDTCADMAERVVQCLAQAGFEHYEVSGYARPGRRCRHNLNYWTFGDYLAAGAGAHAKLTTTDGVQRQARWASPARYCRAVAATGLGAQSTETVPPEALPFEFMLNVLRLTEGVPARMFTERTGLALETIAPVLEDLRAKDLLIKDPARIQTTGRGLLYLSDVQEAFL